jgi:hypothetical protein
MSSEVSLYVDLMLIDSILCSDDKFHKKAGFINDLLSRMKEYFGEHIDKSNPANSVINILAPGTLWVALSSVGLGKWGMFLGLLMEVFHVNAGGILSSLWNGTKDLVSTGNPISSAQIDGLVDGTISEHTQPATQEEAQSGYQVLKKNPQLGSGERGMADDKAVYSSSELLSDARFISLALIEYESQKMRLTKSAGFFSSYNGRKAQGVSLLSRIFGFVIKIALASAGLMVVGDLINKFLGRPNGIDKTYHPGKEEEATPSAPAGPTSTQTKFPSKGDAALPRSMPLMNNPANITSMLVQFAKDTYSGLDGKEGLITSSPAFQGVKEQIEWFNVHNEGSAAIFLPPNFTSKKEVVDLFIDDVARAS